MSEYIRYAERTIPVITNAECVVVGGGPAGCAAAIAASKCNKDVLIIEKYGFLGGASVSQLVPVVLSQNGMDFPPVWYEWILAMKRFGPVTEMIRGEQREHWFSSTYSPESSKYAWDSLLTKYGVRILFHSMVIDVVKENDEIKYIIISVKGGLYAISGSVFIDCTGDGNIAFLSGEEYVTQGISSPIPQACTKMFRLLNARKIGSSLTDEMAKKLTSDYMRSVDSKEFSSPVITSGYVLKYILAKAGKELPDDILLINATRMINVDSLDPWQLSEAEIKGREYAYECARFYKEYVPGCENSSLLDTSIELGVRASRRIKCLYELTIDDILSFRCFEDAIAFGSWEIDVHSPTDYKYGMALENNKREALYRAEIIKGKCYQIPMRSLIPLYTRNLLVAGRCICTDAEVLGSVRIQQTCMATGTAAGVIAAFACTNRTCCKDVDVFSVVNTLMGFEEENEAPFAVLKNIKPAGFRNMKEDKIISDLNIRR